MRKPFADIRNEAILSATATFDIEPKSVTEHTQWLHERHRVPVAVVDGKVVGRASLTRSEWQQGCHARGSEVRGPNPLSRPSTSNIKCQGRTNPNAKSNKSLHTDLKHFRR
jgi:hypothetical protein